VIRRAVVLHAALLDGSLAVWAEPVGTPRNVRAVAARSSAGRSGETYGLDAKALRALLADTFGPAVVPEALIASALAWQRRRRP
jgi:hypothetical protein